MSRLWLHRCVQWIWSCHCTVCSEEWRSGGGNCAISGQSFESFRSWRSAVKVCIGCGDGEAVDRVVKDAQAIWGRLDVVVNNAGSGLLGSGSALSKFVECLK